jgi:ATP-dependent DNA helicase RecG
MTSSRPIDKAEQFFKVLELLSRPLRFASKDDFAHIGTLKGLEQLVDGLCKEGAALGISKKTAVAFKDLKEVFTGFDALGAGDKKERVLKAMAIIESIKSFEPVTPSEARDTSPDMPLGEVKKRLQGLKTPLEMAKGIGPKLAARLKKKGLTIVEDVLYFLPFRYEDRRRIKKVGEIEPGTAEVVTGEVMAMGEVRYGRRKVFEVVVSDGSGLLKLKWFNYRLPYMKKRYKTGQMLSLYGNVSMFGRQKEIIHPDVEIMDDTDDTMHAEGIVPIYSQVENLHQKTIRRLVRGIVEKYARHAVGGTPGDAVKRCGLMPLQDAFMEAHAPADTDGGLQVELARKSITFDELFSLELGLALRSKEHKREGGIAFKSGGRLENRLMELLPFTLTGDQKRVIEEIKTDMASPHPMNRLIQGDVGSGKTIVSLIAVLNAVESGYQAAIMAPTEILAEQHYLTTHRYADPLGIKSVLLTSSTPKALRDKTLKAIEKGEVDFIIGTHALIQKDVSFRALGLAVIDEQHRFGVVQRAALKKKGVAHPKGRTGAEGGRLKAAPDILVMTATPIPRTLSMTVFGDLDVSIINELPPGRKPVTTRLMRERDREKAYGIIRGELQKGGQAYIVYPLVEESEELSLKDATNMKEHLQKDIFGDYNVGLLHGRMKGGEKELIMKAYKEKEIDILVSTTVIEVGVDVPGATVMLIEHAERFGLAQLHQLRGRVGRGEKGGQCLLLAAYTGTEDTWRRLKVMEETTDGFRIAEEDLKIRGPGDFIGTRQSGLPDFRTQDVFSDLTLLKKAREEAFSFLESDPNFVSPAAIRIKEVLKARWKGRLELAEVG